MSEKSEASARAGGGATAAQAVALALLRIAVGWHFLYEGLWKLFEPQWTSAGYLQSSRWVLADAFQWIAGSPTALKVVDVLNIWGLILIGVALMAGCLTRAAAWCGIAMLALYYAAHPPLFAPAAAPVEGHYLLVDKNLVELVALAVVALVPGAGWLGIGRLVAGLRKRPRPTHAAAEGRALEQAVERDPLGRRAVLASLTGLPFLGVFVLAFLRKHGWGSHEEAALAAKAGEAGDVALAAARPDAVTTATIKTFEFSSLKDLKGQVPHAKIGELELSRVILGGNLIGGWAHARDLIYVSKLVKAYHHKWKIFETFLLAEKCGINTFLTNPVLCGVINEYWKRGIGKIQFISDCGGRDVLEMVKQSIDGGACACYVQGGTADRLVREGKFDLIAKALELIRKHGQPAGIGGHAIATVTQCVERGLKPDFWMKTLHHTRYWSASPKKQHDNIWCEHPDETVAFMATRPEPWIAFKTLAAGAIHPKVGFPYAFKGGADFICVGMYDFQIVDDVNLALGILGGKLQRQRPWRA